MPRKIKRRKQTEEEHTHLGIRVDHYEASVEAAVNYNVYSPQSAWNSDDDDPLYRFTTRLIVAGISTYPEERAGDLYEVTIYGDNLGSGDVRATLKDVQERDEYGSAKYRSYRGRQIPIYNPPLRHGAHRQRSAANHAGRRGFEFPHALRATHSPCSATDDRYSWRYTSAKGTVRAGLRA